MLVVKALAQGAAGFKPALSFWHTHCIAHIGQAVGESREWHDSDPRQPFQDASP
jgi:hypothetical protein